MDFQSVSEIMSTEMSGFDEGCAILDHGIGVDHGLIDRQASGMKFRLIII